MPALITTHAGSVERYYTCPRCGAKGEVAFRAVGSSHLSGGALVMVLRSLARLRRLNRIDSPTASVDDAEAEQRRDADRIMGLIRCPRCRRRPRGAAFWPLLRVTGLAALGAVIVSLRIYVFGAPWWVGASVFAALGVISEARRFGRANRVAAVKMAPGAMPLPGARLVDSAAERMPALAPRAAAPLAPGAEPSVLGGDPPE